MLMMTMLKYNEVVLELTDYSDVSRIEEDRLLKMTQTIKRREKRVNKQ